MKQVTDNKLLKKIFIHNKTVFLLKRKTTLIVDNKRGCFVVDNSFSPVCKTIVDNYALQSMFVASGFFPRTGTDMRSDANYQTVAQKN